jgi:methionyl-tRNA formyltransferase
VDRISQKTLGPSTYFGGRKPEDGELTFGMAAEEAFNLIRAVTDPWPNAFLKLSGGTLKVTWAEPASGICPPGTFAVAPEGVLLGFVAGALRLLVLGVGGERLVEPRAQVEALRRVGLPEAAPGRPGEP